MIKGNKRKMRRWQSLLWCSRDGVLWHTLVGSKRLSQGAQGTFGRRILLETVRWEKNTHREWTKKKSGKKRNVGIATFCAKISASWRQTRTPSSRASPASTGRVAVLADTHSHFQNLAWAQERATRQQSALLNVMQSAGDVRGQREAHLLHGAGQRTVAAWAHAQAASGHCLG